MCVGRFDTAPIGFLGFVALTCLLVRARQQANASFIIRIDRYVERRHHLLA